MEVYLKILLLTLSLVLSLPVLAQNLSDNVDANNMPASAEERENEVINSRDSVDLNTTPAQLEEREKEERPESDFNQIDDVEKSYDPLDDEMDE